MAAFDCIWSDAARRKRGVIIPLRNCEGGGPAYLRTLYELRCLVQTAIILPFQDMDYGKRLGPPLDRVEIRACSLTERVLFTNQCLPAPRKLDM